MENVRWAELYSTAEKILAAAPWAQIPEDMIFGVQPRADGPVYFASVMGMAGVHRAIAFYRGSEGIHGFRRANDEECLPRLAMEALLLTEQFQLAFESKKDVLPGDLTLLKACGKRYRGNWPVFHVSRPGRIPWTISAAEAPEFHILVDRALAVVRRVLQGENLLRHFNESEFFLVDPHGRDAECRVDEMTPVRHILQFALPKNALDSLPRVDSEVEIEIALMLSPIQGDVEGEAPFLPFALVMMDVDSGMATGYDMLETSDGVDAAMIRLPEKITGMLEKAGFVPRAIRARHPSVLPLLEAYCRTYEIELIEVEEFEHADFLIEQMKQSIC